jgi:hypothetical protein
VPLSRYALSVGSKKARGSPVLGCLILGLVALGALSKIPAEFAWTFGGCLALALTVLFIRKSWGNKSKTAKAGPSPWDRLRAIISEGSTSTDPERLGVLLAEIDVIRRQNAEGQSEIDATWTAGF